MQIPYTVDARPDTGWTNGQLAMWLFLASEVMLFGALFSSYVILRAGATEWPTDALSLGAAAVNTVVLLASSFTLVRAAAAARASADGGHRLMLTLTIVLALVFLGIKSFEYREHWAAQEFPATNTFFATYYTLTGFHALHIASGVAVLLYLLGPGARLQRAAPAHFTRRLEYLSLYWFFVDAVWLCLVGLLYVW